MAGFEDTPHWKALNERVYAVFSGDTSDWKKPDGTEVHEGNPLWDELRAMKKRLDELEAGGSTALVPHTHDGGETGPAKAS